MSPADSSPSSQNKDALQEYYEKLASDHPIDLDWVTAYQKKWDGQLARSDWERPFNQLLTQNHEESQPINQIYQRGITQLRSQMESKFIQTEEQKLATNPQFSAMPKPDLRDQAMLAVDRNHNYKYALQGAVNLFSKRFQDATSPANRGKIMGDLGKFEDNDVSRMIDGIAINSGGFSSDDFADFRKRGE